MRGLPAVTDRRSATEIKSCANYLSQSPLRGSINFRWYVPKARKGTNIVDESQFAF